MNKRTRFLSICMAACGLVTPLWAQDSPARDWPYRVEVFGSFGNGRLHNGDDLWGSGLEYGGGIGVRPFSGWLTRIRFEFDFAWAGTFGETNDGLPYIGNPYESRVFYAMGYGGNGITFSIIAANLIVDAILKRKNPDAEVFSFNR